ncbi:hypothetical protein [Alkalihalobacterium chitinilyticum]|uniref:Uncharacterized protein n=1 Tax=Alkalihalobacterium chitinilyticum TaxID=2980103 RepID=A0ABT5VJ63_9BACI|nr:hypothetical protein [Alkalihalobacterium chitinilyticum]MDE5415488.1 hypothetical protein [Alkalihalobacterium chitinilyticum]
MQEITLAGYQNIRTHMENSWKFIELRDDAGNPVVRLSTDDPRVSWTHAPDAQTLELSIVLKGDDAEISLPQKFNSSVIFGQASGGDALAPVTDFALFEMATTEDQITVRHRIEVPRVGA